MRGPSLIPTRCTVLCSRARHIYTPLYWLILRTSWLRPDKIEKLLTGTFNLNKKNSKDFDDLVKKGTGGGHQHESDVRNLPLEI